MGNAVSGRFNVLFSGFPLTVDVSPATEVTSGIATSLQTTIVSGWQGNLSSSTSPGNPPQNPEKRKRPLVHLLRQTGETTVDCESL
jgi:hypothetical protein